MFSGSHEPRRLKHRPALLHAIALKSRAATLIPASIFISGLSSPIAINSMAGERQKVCIARTPAPGHRVPVIFHYPKSGRKV